MEQKKILLVEDDEMLAGLYAEKFEMEGYVVFIATNGFDGLKIANEKIPDFILLDIIMPKMDGFVTLKRLKKNPKTKDIPVILLTNLGQEDDVNKGRSLGAVDYFIKANHTPSEIVQKVKDLLKDE
ncbi:MAG: hypothetical protein A3B74_02700 [Candidatus Kerfeldbacteria bacterium RIFCSPHIGHO2_02_FULL_42_14]|uniref:Response regulatory domain-containing protein n=1 Tax=Candidatus Kerfeldbacteria bacterium RIFCSPHIGHO2_02_FULL_42_14 TaxID=1798540 RepID=A0A1G2AUK0_9BACT|nr:MAG: hypothetical protein A3B74_02700 [Candidatus Kerfeldbacteria bacterium RIFCSPHIGHO2_02_FULL_42_14]OGY80449.1 MAG: hypothetical protein A3E60_05320 [Candidatus Kerfeldbacteria bacterium RIFCSPHIGHO2_12_FULL_42_13]OGY83879.1 MAG: hypothetical protein A3I91_04845 [Candidatus Kerfeldbacteria bacterium RIFCSPLOWO2_02_FULL_42_19]OGY86582.1 MAG: hypothetical protein A3G01_04985 [Candidatus Kerfeldbacteria bacterium RIFCSPLOWO2_12_FULL_43_9]